MSYEQLMNMVLNNEQISNIEIKKYLGNEIINSLMELYKFCDEYDFNIFTHGSHGDINNVKSMFEQGYILSEQYIEENEFINETGIIDYKTKLKEMKYFEDEDSKRYSVIIKPKNNSLFDDMPQHFLKGKIGLMDLISRIVIGRGEYPCNLMYFIITPNNKKISSEIMGERFSVIYDDTDEVEFSRQDTIATENIALCIDVKDKKVYFNKNYNPKYLVSENDRFMNLTINETTDGFMESIKKDKLNNKKEDDCMAKVYLICGKICSGKSYYSKKCSVRILECRSTFKECKISYGDYLEYWLDNYCRVNLKYNTVQKYQVLIRKYIKPKLGKYRLPTITSASLNAFITEVCEQYDFSRQIWKKYKNCCGK